IETAEYDDRKHLEAHDGELIVDAEHRSPDDATKSRDDTCHRPGKAEIALHVDAHGHGDLLAVRHRAHGNAGAALEEEPGEAGEKHETDAGTDQFDRRKRERAKFQWLVADRHDDGAGSRAEYQG